MRRVITGILIVAVISAAVGGVLWWRQQRSAAELPEVLRTQVVTRGDLELTVSASGNIAVRRRTDLRAQGSGTVAHVLVAPNDSVRSNDLLLILDTDQLERAVSQAEIALAQAQLDLETELEPTDPEEIESAERAVQSAAQALEVARLGKQTARVDAEAMVVEAQREREAANRRLVEAEGGSGEEAARENLRYAEAQERIARINAEVIQKQAESQWQNAYINYEQAQAKLAKLREGPKASRIKQLELQVEQAQLRLEQARENLVNAAVLAPHDGFVAAIEVEEGTQYRAGDVAATLLDDSTYFVEITVDELDIAAVEIGQPVVVSLDAYSDVDLTGKVTGIAPAATSTDGIVSYRVRVELLDTSSVRIFESMTASVRIRTDVVEEILLIPSWAAYVDQGTGEVYCYRISNGAPQRRTIELGRHNETYTEVVSGLEEGDEVALVAQRADLLSPPEGGFQFGN
ncbi:MAG: efflux RND transporter periplasmic adaptor subunit [Anaerolineae bacterium]